MKNKGERKVNIPGREQSAILTAISKVQSFDDLCRVLVDTCAREFNAEVCTIWRRYIDDKGAPRLRLLTASAKAPQTLAQEITYAIDEEDREGRNADGVTGYIAQTRKEVRVSSFKQLKEEYGFCWKGRMDKRQWEGAPEEHFHSLFAFPLLLGENLIGVMKLENKRNSPEGFTDEDCRSLRDLVNYIALAVFSFNLLEPHEERLIQVPAKMVEALLQPFDPKHLVSEIVKTVALSLHAEICSLWLVDPISKELRLADGYGFSTEARATQTYRLSEESAPDDEIDGITAWVAVRKKPFWANSWEELKAHPSWKGKWDKSMWHSRNERFRCLYAMPLIRENSVIGVLKVENRMFAAFFTQSDRALCGIMASLIILLLDISQQLRTSLISELAHIIRSPIGQVPTNLQSIERELEKFKKSGDLRMDRVQDYIQFIKKALLSVIVTTRTLVAYSQKGVNLPHTHHPEEVSLSNLVEERIREIESLLYGGITIEKNLSLPENVVMYLDITEGTRFQIAIDNILQNAIKYSKKNGIVHVNLNQEGNNAVLTIQDKGIGISEEDLPRIFEPGFSRRAVGHPVGTGMGLTMAKQILDRLGAQCSVQSKIGIGTTFQIFIPITEK